jgi:hypothetical protein
MRTHGYSSAADSRLWLVAVLLGVILMLAATARANAASAIVGDANATLGAIAPEIVIEDNSLIVDLVSTAGSTAISTTGGEAFEFVEQNVFLGTTNASVSTTREQFHYLQDNLEILEHMAPAGTERYDRRQFLSNDNGEGSDVAGSPQLDVAENEDGTSSAGYASGRYDHIQLQTGQGSGSNANAATSRGLRYDEMKFLEDNVTSISGVSGDSNASVRLHHDSYSQAKSVRTKEWAESERDRIQFYEDNWLYSEPAPELPPLVNEHLAQ